MSAPPIYGHRHCFQETAYKHFPSTPRPAIPTMSGFIKSRTGPIEFKTGAKLPRITLKTPGNSEGPLDAAPLLEDEEEADTHKESKEVNSNGEKVVVLEEISELTENKIPFYQKTGNGMSSPRPQSDTTNKTSTMKNRQKSTNVKFMNAPFIKPRPSHVSAKQEIKTELPPFVQVETLHQGDTFVSL